MSLEQPSIPESKPTPEEIKQAAEVLARLEPGFLPRPLFEQVTRLCVTPIIELVPVRKGGKGIEVLLFTRPDDDLVWAGQLHTPGTVLRTTDVDDGIQAALKRIEDDEIGAGLPNKPVFADTVFHKVARGAELATVYYVDMEGVESVSGAWYPADALPENIVDTQKDFIRNSVEAFERSIRA